MLASRRVPVGLAQQLRVACARGRLSVRPVLRASIVLVIPAEVTQQHL